MIWTKNELAVFANFAKHKPNTNLNDFLVSFRQTLNDLENSIYTPNYIIGYTPENSDGEIEEIFNSQGKQLLNLLQTSKSLFYKLKN